MLILNIGYELLHLSIYLLKGVRGRMLWLSGPQLGEDLLEELGLVTDSILLLLVLLNEDQLRLVVRQGKR